MEPIRCLTRRQRHRKAYVAFELNRSATNIYNDPSVSARCVPMCESARPCNVTSSKATALFRCRQCCLVLPVMANPVRNNLQRLRDGRNLRATTQLSRRRKKNMSTAGIRIFHGENVVEKEFSQRKRNETRHKWECRICLMRR